MNRTATGNTMNLAETPTWLENTYVGEPVHGWWAITEHGPICHDGCLAPGSSPHSHATVVGYWIITDRSRIRTDTDGIAMSAGVLHPVQVTAR